MPKTKQQCEQLKLERKESIIRGALYLFSFKGYKYVTVDDICELCKCSHGLFYHYFKDKEELFHALMKESVTPIIHNIVEPYYLNKDINTLEEIITNMVNYVNDDCLDKCCIVYFFLTLHNRIKNIPKMKKETADKIKDKKPLFVIFEELISKGQKDDMFLDGSPSLLAATMLNLIEGSAIERLMSYPNNVSQKLDSNIVMRLIKKG